MTQKGQKLEKYDNCIVCGKPLTGRQRKYCCKACKDKHERSKNLSYKRQRQRGIDRKLELIKLKGGCCEKCGYSSNHTEQFNVYHVDGDLNNCRPSNLKTICANCQRILQKTGVRWKQGDLIPDF